MRISDATRFPHPVLSEYTHDFTAGEFSVAFTVEEVPSTGAFALLHEITLTEPSIEDLVTRGEATIGCFVRCEDTYFTQLIPLAWPSGRSDFVPGALLNRVTLLPMVWLTSPLLAWNPGSIHPEFQPPVNLDGGDLLAVAAETLLSIGQAKFAPIESIFELLRSSDTAVGIIKVDPERDRIAIMVAPPTFDAIAQLRGQSDGQAIVMNAVYLPAVMEILALLSGGNEQFQTNRWYQPFTAKCDFAGVTLTPAMSVLEDAQTLLDSPIAALSRLVAQDET
jgi:hypothetical protein